MSNRENVPVSRVDNRESSAWTLAFFREIDPLNYSFLNLEQEYTLEAQYPHIQSQDFVSNLPLTSLHLSSATTVSSNTTSMLSSLAAFVPQDSTEFTASPDFHLSPRGSPFRNAFELSDDWMASGSYMSPIIHMSHTKPTTILNSSPAMSFLDRLQTTHDFSPASVFLPRHARTNAHSAEPLISPPNLTSTSCIASSRKENDPHSKPRFHNSYSSFSSPFPSPTSSMTRWPLPKLKYEERPRTPQPVAYALSPMSPLTPLTPSPTEIAVGPVRSNPKKRRLSRAGFDSPTISVKRIRYSVDTMEYDVLHAPSRKMALFVFTTRTFPSAPISPNFPLFYRRFPVSSYLSTSLSESPCTLFGMSHPGGVYNAPRDAFDLYTPRFVKGVGVNKVGLCPICVEVPERGGEGKKVWLFMRYSAFNYHMHYHHGISASTARPLSPPIEFRVLMRELPKKNERASMRQGKCHRCLRWVDIEAVKNVEAVKIKEIFWWKHAVACHAGSTLEGEGDVFEEDEVYEVLRHRASGAR